MKGIVLKNYECPINDFVYVEGDVVDVTELEHFNDYGIYYENTLDWIPKRYIVLIKDVEDEKND